MTSSDTLSKCFKGGNVQKESKQWLKHFQNILQRSFKKIRITKPLPKSDIIIQMREKASLMNKLENLEKCLKLAQSNMTETIVSQIILVQVEIEEIEVLISNLTSMKNVKKIKEHFLTLSDSGSFGSQNMWRLKRKLNLKGADVPTAKKDLAGNLVTSRSGLLQLYKNTYIERLSHKEALKDYQPLQLMKETLFNMRFEIASYKQSDNWSADQVEKICKSLHNSKARDELGLVYELFKPPFAGQDVYQSLAKMFNEMKQKLEIPSFFEEMSITSFYKLKGLKSDLSNERGVFNVVKLRYILDKLIYKDAYPTMEQNLSFSNVGGRKGRNIRDHLFVLYSIINDVKNGKAQDIEIQGYDIAKCFDEMCYEETHNDLYDVGIQDDRFAMIAKLDEHAKAVVKTPCGSTEKFELNKIVMQGTVFAPIKCSIQIDTLGRDCLANSEGEGLYVYKRIVDVPALSMIDDVIGVTNCNDEAVELNAIINVKMESKKLRLSDKKCFKLHIGKKHTKCLVKLKAHNETISNVKKATYLGDILNEEGTIDDTVASRKDKGVGKNSQICSILNCISLGMFFIDIAMILRDSMLINGILTNCEVWFSLKEEHILSLESADNDIMRKIFNAHCKTAIEIFFIETAKIPIRFILSKRRLMYLWNILRKDKNELISKVYYAQKITPTKGDWYQTLIEEKEKYEITLSDEEISKLSKYKFKRIVDKKVNSFACQYLKQKGSKHEKSLKILELVQDKSILKRQEYLKGNNFSKTDCQLLFKLRSKMLDVKTNFSHFYNKDLSCRTCRVVGVKENEDHLLKCKMLVSEISDPEVQFEYVFKDLEKQTIAIANFKAVLRKRDILLKLQEENH